MKAKMIFSQDERQPLNSLHEVINEDVNGRCSTTRPYSRMCIHRIALFLLSTSNVITLLLLLFNKTQRASILGEEHTSTVHPEYRTHEDAKIRVNVITDLTCSKFGSFTDSLGPVRLANILRH